MMKNETFAQMMTKQLVMHPKIRFVTHLIIRVNDALMHLSLVVCGTDGVVRIHPTQKPIRQGQWQVCLNDFVAGHWCGCNEVGNGT
jgi:hypothetical protein